METDVSDHFGDEEAGIFEDVNYLPELAAQSILMDSSFRGDEFSL